MSWIQRYTQFEHIFCTDIHSHQRMNHTDSGDPLIFLAVPPWGWYLWFLEKYVNIRWIQSLLNIIFLQVVFITCKKKILNLYTRMQSDTTVLQLRSPLIKVLHYSTGLQPATLWHKFHQNQASYRLQCVLSPLLVAYKTIQTFSLWDLFIN